MSQTKILIADDHAIIRTGIRYLLTSNFRISAIEETEDCAGVREALRNQNYTHLILDLQLSDGHGIGMLPEITREYPELSVLVYTMCSEEVFGKRVLQAGAKGFLRKDSPEEEVLRALNLFLGGRKYVSPQLQAQLMRESGRQTGTINPFDELSDREILVLTQLLAGKGVKEIAGQLNLKSSTIATFKARIFDKCGVNNLMDLRSVAEQYNFKP